MYRVNPRVDLAFKKIFGVEENKDLLISLINSIVTKEDQVKEVTLLNPYNPKSFLNDKLSVLDIKAKGESGKMFNIEIQVTDEANYDKRALYYWAKLYAGQLKEGSRYSELNKTIGIHILNFTGITNIDKYHNIFRLKEDETGLKYFEDIELHTIELNKFADNVKEELSDIVKKVKNALDIWVAFFTRNDLLNKDKLPKELNSKELKKALNVLEVINLSDEEREEYENRLNWLRIEASAVKKMEEKTIEKIAKKMLIKKRPIEEIMEFTELPMKEIQRLR
ncbi:Rpn family recombination-promoting nuclease/putative transposase [Rickettsia hoogstraalii]|uniref:Rpn family recombination-promoting nuclease/putative transposase n=1 Tax=Rickettsia hoogstraalii TaxID=467174 RepID=UPI0022585EF6|nr:Rpn family recombination-promoting nuclease/putative transposase [Rickettsia hoogstraalii]MCX4084765.1 Rpn family recombination-promoting nuclease/putative transposase [Rickettsia hoogstraalii]